MSVLVLNASPVDSLEEIVTESTVGAVLLSATSRSLLLVPVLASVTMTRHRMTSLGETSAALTVYVVPAPRLVEAVTLYQLYANVSVPGLISVAVAAHVSDVPVVIPLFGVTV